MTHDKLNLTSSRIYNDLLNQFYVSVPFPLDRSFLEETIQAFFTFLDEPDAVKDHINFSIAPQHRRGDVGFKRRNPDDHAYNDSKEFFHFHPALLEKYACFLEDNPAVNCFMRKAHVIWEKAYQAIQDILSLLEPCLPGIRGKVFGTGPVHILLRFLRYDWHKSTRYLAKPHYDAGSFTLAIAESCPGLRIGSGPDDLQPVVHQPEHALFMLSGNFQKVMDTKQLSPAWHDVIQLDDSWVGKPFLRWAIVAFIEAQGAEAPPRTETHKWYKVKAG